MPEAVLEPQVTESLGWRAGLPDDLKQNEALVPFKTVGEFAKHHLEVSTKAADLEKKLSDYVPKLPDNASDEDRNLYYDALGRPKDASEYKLDGEDKNAPEWMSEVKKMLHQTGQTPQQAAQLNKWWNSTMQQMVEKHNATVEQEITSSETKLRTEWGDKYDTNVELAKRLWKQTSDEEFDNAFKRESGSNRFAIMRYIVKTAARTGEDRSPQAGQSQGAGKQVSFIAYDKSPAPPRK